MFSSGMKSIKSIYAEVNGLTPMHRQGALTELSWLFKRKISEMGREKFRGCKVEW